MNFIHEAHQNCTFIYIYISSIPTGTCNHIYVSDSIVTPTLVPNVRLLFYNHK